MLRYPQVRRYTIRYYEMWFHGVNKVVTYNRETGQFSNGDVRCGCGGKYVNVTDEKVREVAAKRGTMDDFKKLGGVEYP